MNHQKNKFLLFFVLFFGFSSLALGYERYDDTLGESSAQETAQEYKQRMKRIAEFEQRTLTQRLTGKTITQHFTDVKNWFVKKWNNFRKPTSTTLEFSDHELQNKTTFKPSLAQERASMRLLKVKNLSPSIIKSFSQSGEITLFTPEQIGQLTSEQIKNISTTAIALFDEQQIQNFNFADLTDKQMTELVKNRNIQALTNVTKSQLQTLSLEQIEICLKSPSFTADQKIILKNQKLVLEKLRKPKKILSNN